MLYIVSTPIGNLDDITFRAVEILKKVDLIAAEDTRHSKKLLEHYGIATPMLSLHEYNERQRAQTLLERLAKGQSIALISDAGTPLISDPGYHLTRTVVNNGFQVTSIPGPCAAIAALVVSGLPTDRFVFEGFLPPKGAIRRERLIELQKESRTIIIYESVHRVVNLIELMLELYGPNKEMVLAREITKNYETVLRGEIGDIHQKLTKDPNQQRGEFVIILQGFEHARDEAAIEKMLKLLLAEVPLKTAVRLAEEITGEGHNKLYKWALELREE